MGTAKGDGLGLLANNLASSDDLTVDKIIGDYVNFSAVTSALPKTKAEANQNSDGLWVRHSIAGWRRVKAPSGYHSSNDGFSRHINVCKDTAKMNTTWPLWAYADQQQLNTIQQSSKYKIWKCKCTWQGGAWNSTYELFIYDCLNYSCGTNDYYNMQTNYVELRGYKGVGGKLQRQKLNLARPSFTDERTTTDVAAQKDLIR